MAGNSAYRNQVWAGQLGISPEQVQQRLSAMQQPAYVQAAYGGKGKSVSPELLAHQKAGGTYAGYLGNTYEFLDRGGLGAKGNGTGFAGVSPGVQAPATAAAGPAAAVAPAGARPGFAGVQPMKAPSRGLRTSFGAAGR